MASVTFLGTGAGKPKRSFCTSILLEDGPTNLLLDAGGGHGLLVQLAATGKTAHNVDHAFISHQDSDHILGVVALIREARSRDKPFTIFCSTEVKLAIEQVCNAVAKKHLAAAIEKKLLHFVVVGDRMKQTIGGWNVTFFDLMSTKTPQFGCVIDLGDKRVGFPGDEPIKDHYAQLLENVDVLLHDAFCLEADEDEHLAREKNHSTVIDAAKNATQVSAKQLILFHMKDEQENRRELFINEAKEHFSGPITVPNDLDVIEF